MSAGLADMEDVAEKEMYDDLMEDLYDDEPSTALASSPSPTTSPPPRKTRSPQRKTKGKNKRGVDPEVRIRLHVNASIPYLAHDYG